jgi:retron-type reverse transcriptase
MIPKANGELRSLRIPTARDRTAQAALKLILEGGRW